MSATTTRPAGETYRSVPAAGLAIGLTLAQTERLLRRHPEIAQRLIPVAGRLLVSDATLDAMRAAAAAERAGT